MESAAAREQQFADTSFAYRQSDPLRESDVIVEVEDVALCVPARFSNKLKIPWEMIQTTRGYVVGGIMLDIGANIGQTSVPRVLLGDFQAVYAAEPDPANYARLKCTIDANRVRGFVLPDRVAMGSHDGLLRFHVGHYRSHRAATESESDAIEVPCLRLDSWVEQLQIDVDAVSFVKVDTNGFETDVLRGAERLLQRRTTVWQLEVAPAFMKPLGADVEILCDEVRRHFSHFVDLGRRTAGARPATELIESLQYLSEMGTSKGGKAPQTDLLCFNL